MKKKLRTLPLIISLVLVVVLMPRPIMAQELTVGQSVLLTTQAANPYESVYQDADGDGYFEVPCTKVAWQKAYDVCGVALPGWGNAGTWLASAQAAGYSTGTTARVNSIAVFNIGYYGHVSFVTAVNGSTMTVYEGGRTDLDTTSSHGVATSNPSSIVGQGGLIGFIYFGGSGYEDLGSDFYAAIAAIGDGNWITLENHDPYSVNVQLCSTKNDLTDVRQQWHFVRQADGSYRISSLAGGNLNGDRMAGEGTNVSAAVYVDWDAQRWYIVRNGNGYSLLPKYDTGLCLDVVNANYSLGTNIQLWSRNNGGAQIFDIYKYDTTRYPLVENLGADFYANIAAIGGGDWITLENHDINVQLCSGKIDPTDNRQQWHFVRQADGSYRISSLAGGNLNGDRMAGEGTNVSAAVYVDWDAQRWYIVRNGNGYSLLPKYDTGLCLDVVNANYSLGTNIQLWSRNNGGAQIFDINECEITPAQPAITSITDGVITIADQQYTGEALRPTLTVRVGSATLKSGTDYTVSYANNTNAGTATVTVAGKGNYTGSKSATFKIAAANLSGASISGLPNLTYSGKAQTPTPTVTLNGATLNNGTDYTVAYKDNTNVGTATVTVTGKGNYAGAKSATFKIAAAPAGRTDISRAAISGLKAKTYTGKAQTQNLIVKVGSDTLKSGTDYTVSYKNNTKAGTATVVITGEGSYTGTKTVTFKINKAKQPMVAKATAKKVKAATAKKKAVAVKKAITVKKNQGDASYKNVSKSSTLKKFKVNAKNGVINVPKGTAKGTYNVKVKVIAKGSANYESGSKTVTVKITVK